MLLESASAWLAPGRLWPEPEPALSSQLPPLPPKACSPHSGQRAAVSTESGPVPPLPTALQGFHLPGGKRPGPLPALPASVSPLLFLQPARSSPAPGPLHWLCPLLRVPLPQFFAQLVPLHPSGLSSNVRSSDSPSLNSPSLCIP